TPMPPLPSAAPEPGEPHPRRWAAAAALVLAGGGILVSMIGQRWGMPALERWAGPGLTLLGAGLWAAHRLGRPRH
ncbi:MAG: hypothetical protein AB1578_19220, partial [Thermodesulfobacteriota bacterium]